MQKHRSRADVSAPADQQQNMQLDDGQRRNLVRTAALAPLLALSSGAFSSAASASTNCATGRIRYYDFDGDSDGDGQSPLTPKKTWVVPQSGDVIRLKRGSTWSRTTQLNLGSAENLTFEAWYGADGQDDPNQPKPIVEHSVPDTVTNVWNFQGDGVHRIRNIAFLNCASPKEGGCIIGAGVVSKTQKAAQLEIQHCEFRNIAGNAIRLGGTGLQASPFFKLTHCVFDHIGEDAVYGCASYYEVGHCDMWNLSTIKESGDGVGFIGSDPKFVWIHDNVIDHSSHDAKHCVIIDVRIHSTDPMRDSEGFAIIEDNTFIGYGNASSAPAKHTVVNSQTRTILRRNHIKSFGIAMNLMAPFSECTSNLIEIGNATADPVIALYGASSRFENNTVVATASLINTRVLSAAVGVHGVSVRNNAFRDFPSGPVIRLDATGEYKCSHNAFENVGTRYAAGLTSTGDVVANTSGALGINQDGTLQAGSPLIGAGVSLGYRLDLNGNPFHKAPMNPAIGAVEQGSTAS